MTDILILAASLAGLLVFVELAVRGAESAAVRLRIPQSVIGFTIIALGTDLPELAITIEASLQARQGINTADLVLGNAIGSSVAQLTLIGGLAAMSGGLKSLAGRFRLPAWLLGGSVLFLCVMLSTGSLGPIGGLVLLLAYGACVYIVLERQKDDPRQVHRGLAMSILSLLLGLLGIIFFSELTVNAAVRFARQMGIAEARVGLLILGPGSSLPELTVSMWAAFRRMPGLSLGNIIGSNLFDTLAIPGIAAVIAPMAFDAHTFMIQLYILMGASFFLALVIQFRNGIGWITGALLLGTYAGFVLITAWTRSGSQ